MPRFNKSLEQRLGVLEQFAEANTISFMDFFAVLDCFLLAGALPLDTDTMEKIEAEVNTLFFAHLARTRHWKWREARASHARA